ncbi:MAG: 5'-nucleotidase C-terminal domain-containing protein [Myxococcaceae bacterium]
MFRALAALSVVVFLTACPEKPAEAPKPGPEASKQNVPPPRTGKVTLVVTGHEAGALVKRGARLVSQWKKEEAWPDLLAFSTGDSFSGAVISSHFDGESTAEVMKALQYKASAFGNHDMDLGFDTLGKFRTSSGLDFLAANLTSKDAAQGFAPSAVYTRENVKVGVVGFTSLKTLTTTESGRAAGLTLVPLDQAVPRALESLKKDSPDVVVALIDDCFPALKAVLDAHADWKIDLVVGTRCDGAQEDVSGKTKYFSAGDDVSHYVSAKFELKADGTTALTAKRKEVTEKGDEDQDLLALRDRWQKKLDEVLGEKIGFTKNGLKEESPELRLLIATALKDQAKADAALINKKGVRAALPRGAITRATVYDLIPFENAFITVKMKGEALEKFRAMPEAVVVAPQKLDPAKDYVVATTEYIYFGGDGLGLEVVAPEPDFTGQVWQTPVIEWLKAQKSDEKKPLDGKLKSLK